jgi:hypothetical protein
MDTFTKVMLIGAMAGCAICAGLNGARDRAEAFGKEVKLTEDNQEYKIAAEALDEETYPEFVFGSTFSHLEKEKEFVGWVTSQDRYICESYYLGDHYTDPRVIVVREESSGDVVQIFTTASYEKRNQMSKKLDEVPD